MVMDAIYVHGKTRGGFQLTSQALLMADALKFLIAREVLINHASLGTAEIGRAHV